LVDLLKYCELQPAENLEEQQQHQEELMQQYLEENTLMLQMIWKSTSRLLLAKA